MEFTSLINKTIIEDDIDVISKDNDNNNKDDGDSSLNEKNKKKKYNVMSSEETILVLEEEGEEEEDSDVSYKVDENNRTKKIKRRCYISMAILFILWIFCYKQSLKGGRIDEFTPDKLFIIAQFHCISFVCYSIDLWMIGLMNISKKRKAILYSIMVLSLIGFYFYDHGELFDYHGLYNFILFIIFLCIFDTLALILYIWCRIAGPKKFVIQFVLFVVTITTITCVRIRYFMNTWGNGLLGKKIMDNNNSICNVKRPVPWFDLVPNGGLNFWTGSQSCKRKEHFNALFENNKLVVRDCSKKDVTFMIIPETRNFTYVEKDRWELREVIGQKMESTIYHYTEPVELDDVEAVYVTCGEQSKLVTRVASERVKPVGEEQPLEKLNVLLIFIDALSRHHFFRKLPKTAKQLEKIHKSGISHLNQFFRYGTVDINTFGNTLAMYAGIEGIRNQEYEDAKGIPIWEEYRNRGYVAGLVSDFCEDWDVTYNRRTADSLDHELLAPFCLPEYHERTGNPYKNSKGPYSFRRRCITGDYVHNYALKYTKDFIDAYDGKNPWFFYSGFIEAHESTSEVVGLMDDDLAAFFNSLSEETLNRTAIFVMSDHGLHIGINYLFSYQGLVEHKLPLLFSLIPNRFLNKYPELRMNLEDNEQKLISGFNIYETLRDLLEFDPYVEPNERISGGVDISDYLKIVEARQSNDSTVEVKDENNNDAMVEVKDEKLNFSKRLDREYYFSKRADAGENYYYNSKDKPKDNKIYDNINQVNATIVWGKSLLRKVPYRTCQENLIPDIYCVCH